MDSFIGGGSKGVWVILERVNISDLIGTGWSSGGWRAVLASPGLPYCGQIAQTPEEALSAFKEDFWNKWAQNKAAYTLQNMDDYPDGITAYAVRFIPLPHLRTVK